MPRISVIIPAYNAGKYISEAIESVLNQTYKDLEIIVVDDGSTDNTREIIAQYPIPNTSSLKYIYQPNKGPAAARNTGIRAAIGEYIAFLDGDDIWLPEKIELQVNKLKEDAEYCLIHTNRIRMRMDGTVESIPKRVVPEGFVFNELLKSNFIFCSSVLAKKLCFDEVGLFNEDRTNRIEDYDMWLKIAYKYKIGFISQPLVKYRVNPKGYNRKNIKKSYDSEKEVFLKALEHYQGDKEKMRKERFYSMACRMADSFLDVKDYKQGALAFLESVKIRYFKG